MRSSPVLRGLIIDLTLLQRMADVQAVIPTAGHRKDQPIRVTLRCHGLPATAVTPCDRGILTE